MKTWISNAVKDTALTGNVNGHQLPNCEGWFIAVSRA